MPKKIQRKPRRSRRPGKDVLERLLTSDLSVVASILNFIFYDGSPIIKVKDLQILRGEHPYSDSKDQLRELRRDSFILWKEGEVVFSFIGLESQSAIDPDMPLRCFSYDGLGYREQLDNPDGKRYPVITFVIYYGEEPWTKGLTLKERLSFAPKVAPLIEPYFNDYKVNVIDVRRLTKEDLAKLRGVFAFIATCFYVSEHPEEEIQLPKIEKKKDQKFVRLFLQAFLQIEDVNLIPLDELMEGDKTMAELMATAIRRERDAARKEGYDDGYDNGYGNGYGNGYDQGVAQERKESEKAKRTMASAMVRDGLLSKAKIANYFGIDKATLNAWLAEN